MNNEWHIRFGLIFNFCRIELRLTSFAMTNMVLYFLILISVLFSRNNFLKKFCFIIMKTSIGHIALQVYIVVASE